MGSTIDGYAVSASYDYSSPEEVTAFVRHLLDGQTAFNTTTRPTMTEVTKFLQRAGGLVNVALVREGLAIPITNSTAKLTIDDWVTIQTVEYVELTKRGVGYSEEGGQRRAFADLTKAARTFAKENRLAFIRLGCTEDYQLSDGLAFTGQDVTDNRADPDDTSLAQPVFGRGKFNHPSIDSDEGDDE